MTTPSLKEKPKQKIYRTNDYSKPSKTVCHAMSVMRYQLTSQPSHLERMAVRPCFQ